MNEELDRLLDNVLQDNRLLEQQRAQSQRQFETSTVKRIMTDLGVEKDIPRLVGELKSVTGIPQLTFKKFYTEYSNFPLQLVMRKLPYIHQTTIPDLFNNIKKLKFITEWCTALDEVGSTDFPVGLVFPYAGVKGHKLMVCHNLDYDTRHDSEFVRIHYSLYHGGVTHNLCLEQLSALMKYVKIHTVL